jgi:clan AA aspartic protease (TIGR02281 family)
MRISLLLGAILLLGVTTGQAKIYKWTDRHGKIHFTDTMTAIPPAYRDQVEERGSTPVAQQTTRLEQSSSTPSSEPPATYRIPLHGQGNNLFVDVMLNDGVKTRLQVDTGATYTVISRALAKHLHLDLDRADIIPIVTANGTVLVSLTTLASITVGDATVQDMDVIVHDAGGDGLLGMSFLSNFQVAFNTRDREMILTTLSDTPRAVVYAGRSEAWWRYQFAFYRDTLSGIKAYLRDRSMSRVERRKLEKARQVFQQKLVALEHKASRAAVPRHWRY